MFTAHFLSKMNDILHRINGVHTTSKARLSEQTLTSLENLNLSLYNKSSSIVSAKFSRDNVSFFSIKGHITSRNRNVVLIQ